VNHMGGHASESPQGVRFIELSHQTQDAMGSQQRHTRGLAGQGQHLRSLFQPRCHAHTHIATPHDQHTRTPESRRQCAQGALV
jgi:hypothetical protein